MSVAVLDRPPVAVACMCHEDAPAVPKTKKAVRPRTAPQMTTEEVDAVLATADEHWYEAAGDDPAKRYKAALRIIRHRRGINSPGNRAIHEILALLSEAEDLVYAFLDEHTMRCRCDFCLYLDTRTRDKEFLRRDLEGITYILSVGPGCIGSMLCEPEDPDGPTLTHRQIAAALRRTLRQPDLNAVTRAATEQAIGFVEDLDD